MNTYLKKISETLINVRLGYTICLVDLKSVNKKQLSSLGLQRQNGFVVPFAETNYNDIDF